MSRLKQLIHEIHHRSLWQVLLIYIGAAWACFELIATVADTMGLPGWLPGLAIVLFLLGLPFVVATALVREEPAPSVVPPAATEAEAERVEVEAAAARREATRRHRFLTWRNAVASFVVALAVWGVVATSWLLLHEDTAEATAERKSVAVLPFVNLSGDVEYEYFSDGVTVDIINHLSKIADLKVISRTSTFQYKGAGKSLRDIAGALGVATVVEGEVQRVGDRVRVNAQLIDAATDEHLWAEQYDRVLTDVFVVQSDIARHVANALKSKLTVAERTRIDRKPTDNLEAYDSYLLGRHYWNERTPEGIERSIVQFERAIELDPEYVQAYAGLADANSLLAAWELKPPHDVYPRATTAALKALEIDDESGEAHISRAWIQYAYEWDWQGAEASFRRGLELSPQYATGHHWYGFYLTTMGRFDEATAEYAQAHELDPLSRIIYVQMSSPLTYGSRTDEALKHCEVARARYPAFQRVECYNDLIRLGRYEETIREIAGRLGEIGVNKGAGPLGMSYARLGREEEARAVLNDLRTRSEIEYISPAAMAYIYVGLSEVDSALQWLEAAWDARAHGNLFLKVDELLDPLRSDPRFQDLLRRMNFPE